MSARRQVPAALDAGFLRDADDAARAALPGGDAVRLSRGGLVAIRATIVLPVNVAAALEWHDDDDEPMPLAEFMRDAIESSLECDLTCADATPPAVRARLRLPANERTGEDLDRSAAVPFVRAAFAQPSEEEADEARQRLARHFAPRSPEEEARIAAAARRIAEESSHMSARRQVPAAPTAGFLRDCALESTFAET